MQKEPNRMLWPGTKITEFCRQFGAEWISKVDRQPSMPISVFVLFGHVQMGFGQLWSPPPLLRCTICGPLSKCYVVKSLNWTTKKLNVWCCCFGLYLYSTSKGFFGFWSLKIFNVSTNFQHISTFNRGWPVPNFFRSTQTQDLYFAIFVGIGELRGPRADQLKTS